MLSINDTQTSAELAVSDLIFNTSPFKIFIFEPSCISS